MMSGVMACKPYCKWRNLVLFVVENQPVLFTSTVECKDVALY